MSSDGLETVGDGGNSRINFGEIVNKYKVQLSLALIGIVLVGFGVLLYKKGLVGGSEKVQVLESGSGALGEEKTIVVEVAGSVENPGVYRLQKDDRVEDLFIASGGLSADADRQWIEQFVNRAAKLTDGQKLYIPDVNEQSTEETANIFDTSGAVLGVSEKAININTASQKELESLWGIGPVTAQNIIEQRMYSSVEELLSKKILKQNVYDRNKDLMTVY